MLDNAKALRSNQTEAEQRLWYHLRAHRFMGLKFKRQKPIGRYIADFVCMECRLIIEVDGGQHAEQVCGVVGCVPRTNDCGAWDAPYISGTTTSCNSWIVYWNRYTAPGPLALLSPRVGEGSKC